MRLSALAIVGGVAAALAVSHTAHAQRVRVGGSVGLAVPTGRYGQTRVAGPLLRAAVTLGGPEQIILVRGELEGAWLLDREGEANGSATGSSTQGTLRAVGALLSLLAGPRRTGIAPYFVAGGGVQRLTVRGAYYPSRTVAGLRAGAGLRMHVGRAEVHAEVTPHWVLSDYATGRDFAAGSYVPAVVGVTF